MASSSHPARASLREGWRAILMSYRILIFICTWSLIRAIAGAQIEKAEVNLDYVTKSPASARASLSHSPRADLPEVLRADKLNYDSYRKIRFSGGSRFLAGRQSSLSRGVFSSGLHLPGAGANFSNSRNRRSSGCASCAIGFNYSDLKIENKIPGRHGLRGFQGGVSLEQARGLCGDRLVSRGELFPDAGQGAALRSFGARPGVGLRRAGSAGGIPHFHRFLAGQTGTGGYEPARVCRAR